MIFTAQSPLWFLGIDALFEAIFFLITLFIAWYAWRIHRFGGGKHYRTWSLGFLLISISYLMSCFVNILIYHELIERLNEGFLQVLELNAIYHVGYFLHEAVFALGILLLLFVSLRLADKVMQFILTALVVLLAFAALYFETVSPLTHIILLVGVIAGVYRNRHSIKLSLAGFGTLILADITYIIFNAGVSVAYAVGHIFEFVGYGLLATSMFLVLRKK